MVLSDSAADSLSAITFTKPRKVQKPCGALRLMLVRFRCRRPSDAAADPFYFQARFAPARHRINYLKADGLSFGAGRFFFCGENFFPRGRHGRKACQSPPQIEQEEVK